MKNKPGTGLCKIGRLLMENTELFYGIPVWPPKYQIKCQYSSNLGEHGIIHTISKTQEKHVV